MKSEWTDDVARHYAETFGEHPSHPIAVGLAEALADDVVVDVGCGTGNVLRLLSKTVTQGRLVGVDPSLEMVRQAVARSVGHVAQGRLEFVEGAANALPLADHSVTLFMAVHTVHHWDDVGEGLDELRRVIAPGGRLLVCFEENYGSFSADLFAAMLSDMGFVDLDIGVYTVEEDEELQVVRGRRPH
ncbi:MAG: ubiquinone/menaquinone biosynthesis C-methylase UbiE [Myxococcota bacterium]|jgi:ubiquinone/menaquinone biosynthesis C-methylase UbiE